MNSKRLQSIYKESYVSFNNVSIQVVEDIAISDHSPPFGVSPIGQA